MKKRKKNRKKWFGLVKCVLKYEWIVNQLIPLIKHLNLCVFLYCVVSIFCSFFISIDFNRLSGNNSLTWQRVADQSPFISVTENHTNQFKSTTKNDNNNENNKRMENKMNGLLICTYVNSDGFVSGYQYCGM